MSHTVTRACPHLKHALHTSQRTKGSRVTGGQQQGSSSESRVGDRSRRTPGGFSSAVLSKAKNVCLFKGKNNHQSGYGLTGDDCPLEDTDWNNISKNPELTSLIINGQTPRDLLSPLVHVSAFVLFQTADNCSYVQLLMSQILSAVIPFFRGEKAFTWICYIM